VTATRIAASYTNRYRVNLTPCVGVLGHDAAAYYGHLVSAAPSRR
jgi:surface antigen